MISRALRSAGLGFVAVLVLAGCSETTGGSPVASGNGAPTPQRPSTGPTATSGSSADIKPCDLLSASDRATLGVGEGDPDTLGRMPTCHWTASGKFGVQIGLSNKGLAGLNGENVNVGTHKAVKSLETGGFGGCGVVIELSATSTMIVVSSVIGAKTPEESCPRAIEVAKIIDPKLP